MYGDDKVTRLTRELATVAAERDRLAGELAAVKAELPGLLKRLADVAGNCSECPLDENDEDEDGCDCERHGLEDSPCLIAARDARAWAERLRGEG